MGLSRDAIAELVGISQQRLTRLVNEHDIDFPKWRQPK
jgi:plasmid maintenance system antidote protein VapI